MLLWLLLTVLVPGTNMTYTDGVNVWAGNPYCGEMGTLLQPSSPAIDAGAVIEGFHCPQPGSGVGQPTFLAAGWLESPCVEWYGAAPDAGACEFVPVTTQPDLRIPDIEVEVV